MSWNVVFHVTEPDMDVLWKLSQSLMTGHVCLGTLSAKGEYFLSIQFTIEKQFYGVWVVKFDKHFPIRSPFLSGPFPESCRPRSEPMSFFQGMKLVMGHGPYAKLVMGFLFTSLAFMVSTAHAHTHPYGLYYTKWLWEFYFIFLFFEKDNRNWISRPTLWPTWQRWITNGNQQWGCVCWLLLNLCVVLSKASSCVGC